MRAHPAVAGHQSDQEQRIARHADLVRCGALRGHRRLLARHRLDLRDDRCARRGVPRQLPHQRILLLPRHRRQLLLVRLLRTRAALALRPHAPGSADLRDSADDLVRAHRVVRRDRLGAVHRRDRRLRAGRRVLRAVRHRVRLRRGHGRPRGAQRVQEGELRAAFPVSDAHLLRDIPPAVHQPAGRLARRAAHLRRHDVLVAVGVPQHAGAEHLARPAHAAQQPNASGEVRGPKDEASRRGAHALPVHHRRRPLQADQRHLRARGGRPGAPTRRRRHAAPRAPATPSRRARFSTRSSPSSTRRRGHRTRCASASAALATKAASARCRISSASQTGSCTRPRRSVRWKIARASPRGRRRSRALRGRGVPRGRGCR